MQWLLLAFFLLVLVTSGTPSAVTSAPSADGRGSARAALLEAKTRVREADEAVRRLEREATGATSEELHAFLTERTAKAVPLALGARGVRPKTHNATTAASAFGRLLRSLGGVPLPALQTIVDEVPSKPRRAAEAPALAAFMHTGKAGGTAFREAILNRAPEIPGELWLQSRRSEYNGAGRLKAEFSTGRLRWHYEKHHGLEFRSESGWEHHIPDLLANLDARRQNGSLPCICTHHYDFSLLAPLYRALPPGRVVAMALLRDPVDRFLSHFHFAASLQWTEGLKLRRLSPVQFLQDPAALLEALMVWQDGSAAVSWWAGNTVHFGMGPMGEFADNARLQASISSRTETLGRAVSNYRKFAFVGLLEELDASMELLRRVLGWSSAPQLAKLNTNAAKPESTSGERRLVQKLLRALAPMDAWFYDYVKADFTERIAALRRGAPDTRLKPASLPSEEELGGCVATRDAIACGHHLFEK